MNYWLLKTEPHEYSFDDLVAAGVDVWDGVTNATALKHLRDAAVGDACVIYHTGDERRAVGLARVARTAYPDPTQDNSKVVVIDVEAGERLAAPVTLDRIKGDSRFADSPLVRIGRLSIVPLSSEQFEAIREMARG